MEVLAAIRKLIAKAAEHFHRENLLMEQYRYPEHREHRDEHAMLLCSIETWSSNLASSGRPITKEVVHYLKDWLTNHIRTADRRLDRFLISAVRKLGPPGPLAAGTSEAGWTAENTLLWASFHDTVPAKPDPRPPGTKAGAGASERPQRKAGQRQPPDVRRLLRITGRSFAGVGGAHKIVSFQCPVVSWRLWANALPVTAPAPPGPDFRARWRRPERRCKARSRRRSWPRRPASDGR